MPREAFVCLLKEIITTLNNTTKDDYTLDTFCDNWLIVITKNKTKKIKILGYNFDLDGGATNMLCRDKTACSVFLESNNVKCILHTFFYRRHDKTIKDTINDIVEYCDKICYPVVLKQNEGTCGNYIYYVNNDKDARRYASLLLRKFNSLAISKFENIKNEYRFIVINGKTELVYKKIRPYVIGDGIKNVYNLMLEKYEKNILNVNDIILYPQFKDVREFYKHIPHDKIKIDLSWKHNLSKHSSPFVIVNVDKQMSTLVNDTIKVLQIKNCSVDVVENDKNEFKIIEVNNGLMMDNFLQHKDTFTDGYLIAKRIYKEIILHFWEIKG